MDNQSKKQLLQQLKVAAQAQLNELQQDRDSAIEKMTELGTRTDAEARKILISYLTHDDNELLRPLAASRLGEIGGQDVLMELQSLLNTIEIPSITLLIVQILADIGDETATPSLITILDQQAGEDVRRRTAFALGKTGGALAYDALMQLLFTETDLKTRQQVISALGWLGDDRCIPELVQIMQTDTNKETQTFAAEALGRIGHPACFDPLVETLQNQDYLPIVRYYAAHALGLMGDERAISHLQAIINDPSEHSWVAQMAREALEKLV